MDSEETSQAKFFRFFYKLVFLIAGLILLDRSGDIFVPHRFGFWIGFLFYVIVLVAWDELAHLPTCRRWLNSTWITNLTLAWASILCMLLGLEIFLRTDLARYQLLGTWPAGTIYAMTDGPLAYKFNSLGFRDDEEHSIEKADGITRIVLLGDSFTAGQGVKSSEYYPALLREQLGSEYEIIVLARGGASTVDQVEFMRDYGCMYRPDIVIVGVVTNDPHAPSGPNPPADKSYLSARAPNSDSYNPHLAYMIDYYINRMVDNQGWRYSYSDWLEDIFDTGQPWYDEWQAAVKTLADESLDCGADEIYAFTLPSALGYDNPDVLATASREYDILTEVFSEAGFTTVNLFPAYLEEFGNVPFRSLWALPNDGHPGPEIHRWYAEQISAVLEKE